MRVSRLSPKGAEFIAGHEGFVSKAYLCPAGVLTIGFGFTMGSKVFAEYWRQKTGRALRMGDVIGRDEAVKLLPKIVDEEYGRAVALQIAPTQQHHYDGASSVSFNCGTGSLVWRWAQSLKAGLVKQAAEQLRVTAVTANGRKLDGLVRRRHEEARLLETGEYVIPANSAQSIYDPDIRQYQGWLEALGYYTHGVDGVAGPATKDAVRRFQKDNGLVVDAIVGPATRAALIRALDSKNRGMAGIGSGSMVGAGKGGEQIAAGFEWGSALEILLYGGLTLAVVFTAFYIYQNRGRFLGTGRVPT
jgi:lysozyme